MSVDPGLQNDTCPFLEANSGDGGNHAASGTLWESPDINLTGPISGPNVADANKPNPVVVTAHMKPACTPESDAHNVLVELWIGNPALAMAPNINTRQIGATALIPFASFVGNKANHTFTWTPPSGAVDPDPEAPGHKCLISRVYTDSATAIPDSGDFHLFDDQHSAQHNITIVAAPAGQIVHLNISTVNGKVAQTLVFHVVQNFNRPSAAVLAMLSRNKSFKTVATQPVHVAIAAGGLQPHIVAEVAAPKPTLEAAPPAKLNIAEKSVTAAAVHPLAAVITSAAFKPVSTGVQVADNFALNKTTGKFGTLASPNLLFSIGLQARAFGAFAFSADLTHATKGQAAVYDLVQTGSDGKPHGGLTVIVIPV